MNLHEMYQGIDQTSDMMFMDGVDHIPDEMWQEEDMPCYAIDKDENGVVINCIPADKLTTIAFVEMTLNGAAKQYSGSFFNNHRQLAHEQLGALKMDGASLFRRIVHMFMFHYVMIRGYKREVMHANKALDNRQQPLRKPLTRRR